jgi:LmbE family N-acetylglucosaminyl deacetylase
MNVVVIAPHPDDESIGCGGALCRHADAGDRVTALFLTSGELGLKHLAREAAWHTREDEAKAAARILGITELHFLRQPDWMLAEAVSSAATAVAEVLTRERPQLIYVPHPREWHPDHKAAGDILKQSLGMCALSVPEIRGYEVWTPLSEYSVVVDISAVMPRKLEAIRCHASQLADFDYAHAAQSLNAFRGVLAARVPFAEVFEQMPPEFQQR